MLNTAFIDDMSLRRTCARQSMIRCSQSSDEAGLAFRLVQVLNEALATQLMCVLRSKARDYSLSILRGESVKPAEGNPRELADNAQTYVDRLVARITGLGGHADFNPPCLIGRDHRDYVNTDSVADLWREDLIARRIAVDIYREMIRHVGVRDRESRQLLEDMLANEKQQADLLAGRIASLDQRPVRRAAG